MWTGGFCACGHAAGHLKDRKGTVRLSARLRDLDEDDDDDDNHGNGDDGSDLVYPRPVEEYESRDTRQT